MDMLRRVRKPWPSRNSSSVMMSSLSCASLSFSDDAYDCPVGGVYGLGVWRIGWTKGRFGRNEADVVEICEPPLVVRMCGVLRPACANATSDADRLLDSCIPNPDNAPFSDVDLDRSNLPWFGSSLELDIFRRYGLILGVAEISGKGSSYVAKGVGNCE